MMQINGCHAFVTGGGSGIGLAIADALAAQGARITIADVNPQSVGAVVAARGAGWRGEVFDVRDRAGWAAAKASAEAAFGPVDILVNNAGIAPNGLGFTEMTPESYDRIVDINLGGAANGVFAFAGDMKARGAGHIVNTASMAGLTSLVSGVSAYAVAKFGVVALSESLRIELAPFGVGVTTLCPGYVVTNLAENTRALGGELTESAGVFQMKLVALQPADIGRMVVEAIANNDGYVITHPDSWRDIDRRMGKIKAACETADGRAVVPI